VPAPLSAVTVELVSLAIVVGGEKLARWTVLAFRCHQCFRCHSRQLSHLQLWLTLLLLPLAIICGEVAQRRVCYRRRLSLLSRWL